AACHRRREGLGDEVAAQAEDGADAREPAGEGRAVTRRAAGRVLVARVEAGAESARAAEDFRRLLLRTVGIAVTLVVERVHARGGEAEERGLARGRLGVAVVAVTVVGDEPARRGVAHAADERLAVHDGAGLVAEAVDVAVLVEQLARDARRAGVAGALA